MKEKKIAVNKNKDMWLEYGRKRSSAAFRLIQGPLHLLSKLTNSSTFNFASTTQCKTGIIFQNVWKRKGDDDVISNISLKIEPGDLFCFAGVDVDAPCTIVNMICGLETANSGKILVGGKEFDFFGRPRLDHIGYCSNKTTGVMPSMTGEETLYMFARLRGAATFNMRRLVEIYLTAFHLENVANAPTCSYSDCELRRLSIAAALIGEPEFSFLCDPLYKLDSESKQAFWRWLRRLTNLKKTIVMASDDLQEMGHNAAYIVIIVDGKPVSVGTAKSIESLYCIGYTLLVKLALRSKAVCTNIFLSKLTEKLPQCQLFHCHQDLLFFHIPYEQDCLADVFACVEEIKKHLKIESYRINKATLEQVLTAAQKAYFVHGIGRRTPVELEEEAGS